MHNLYIILEIHVYFGHTSCWKLMFISQFIIICAKKKKKKKKKTEA